MAIRSVVVQKAGGPVLVSVRIVKSDCLKALKRLPTNSLDSLVTDPPAGIAFMGKDWDKDKGGRDAWVQWMTDVMRECLRVLKPGAHGLVWSLPRTSHWTATALEDAGFEIRDCVTHLFGSGFPKSLDVSKAIDKAAGAERAVLGRDPNQAGRRKNTGIVAGQARYDEAIEERVAFLTAPATDAAKEWQGWGTALKPAAEFWWLVRKPLSEKTVAANVLKWGTGGINVDGCRIEGAASARGGGDVSNRDTALDGGVRVRTDYKTPVQGRFPANLVLSCCGNDPHVEDCAVRMLDEQSGRLHGSGQKTDGPQNTGDKSMFKLGGPNRTRVTDSGGGASRFFYVAKASKSDRGAGNKHPTVKSSKLMSYLVRLVTPEGGTVLDPFMGSGSTGVAARREKFKFYGIEKEEESYFCARERLGFKSKDQSMGF
jgi:hypothetical protein